MIRIYHNHRLQTNTQDREEPQNTKSHKPSMERYVHHTDLTRSGNTIKKQPSGFMYKDVVEIYLLFNRSCTIKGLKPRVRMCVPNSPLFSASTGILKAGFLVMRVICKPVYKSQRILKGI